MKQLSLGLTFALFFQSLMLSPRAAPDLERSVYDDALATGWQNWSWAVVDLNAAGPVYSGTHSIAVSMDAWEGLYLHHPGLDASGLTQLGFYLHGGGAGGQRLNVFLNLESGGSPQNGPAISVPQPPAGSWIEVQIPLDSLNPAGATITGITWQSAINNSQPTFYVDKVALVSPEDPDGPQLANGELLPRSILADGSSTLVVRLQVSDPQGRADIAVVSLDASSLGRGIITLHDDGRSYDAGPNDSLYGAVLTIAPGALSGERLLLVSAADQSGHQAGLPLGVVSVLASPGGSIPGELPQRIGWGSNAWSETYDQDWQANSGVPWDYVYQYITKGWESWGGSFVYRFVHQAWNKGYIPMVVVYMVLGTPPDCGESATCYADKLRNSAFVNAYIDSLERAAQEAAGSQPVIFNLEPDFYGFMQQLSNSGSPPAGVRPNDPASYPVALNRSGYPNNLSGFGRYLVDRIHILAPNAMAAPMASMWATNFDPQSVTDLGAIQMAQSTAAFIDTMGGAQADLLVVEWSDRDAGSGLRPWWDDSDRDPPRPTRAVLWENALSHASGKRLLLWQVPVGNMTLDNTCDSYRDNRAAYLFNHSRDLFDAGVAGVLFGGGAGCMTQVWTDGGFVAAQGAIAYDIPAAPAGLTMHGINAALVSLGWDENSEPDFWMYRLLYQISAMGPQYFVDVGKRNAFTLLLPQAGDWSIRVIGIDAMGNQSLPSAAINVTTLTDTKLSFLPAILR